MQDVDIYFTHEGALGVISLNRPQQLNALNRQMIRLLHEQLAAWENAPDISAVLIQSDSARAFCAGGDIKAIYQAHLEGKADIVDYFAEEYALNQQIKYYPKPYIALMQGLTMGGGAGISLHGKWRIATEDFIFAMPETAIGFFPDIGASYFLSRLPYNIGIYLGLTGARLNAEEALYAGLIDIIIPNKNQEKIITPLPQQSNHLKTYQAMIMHCFAGNTVEKILANLIQAQESTHAQYSAEIHAWLEKNIGILTHGASPTSLKITLAMLQKAKQLDFNGCMQMELTLASHFVSGHDFYEGIRAAVIDKDKNPRWQPQTLQEVDAEMISAYFKL